MPPAPLKRSQAPVCAANIPATLAKAAGLPYEDLGVALDEVAEDAPITAERPYGFRPLTEIPADYAPETAAEEGCVVFAMGRPVQNGEAMDAFLTKASLGMSCQLRLARQQAEAAVSPVIQFLYDLFCRFGADKFCQHRL